MKQFTFLMLKPDAFEKAINEEVILFLKENHLKIEKSNKLLVTWDLMKVLIDHYQPVIENMPKEFLFCGKLFNTFYADGPHYIEVMKVSCDLEKDIIEYTRNLIGNTNPKEASPDTIRGKFSTDSYDKASKQMRLVQNIIHASDSYESAKRELAIWEEYL